MHFEWDRNKENDNIKKHRLDFSFAELIAINPLVVLVGDRYESGEYRYHALAWIGEKLLLMVHTYPHPDDETFIRVIGLREATPNERRRYEEGNFDQRT